MKYKYLLTQPYFDDDEQQKLMECLKSKWVTQGPMTEQFEKLFMQKHGGDYAIAVCNCTAGLHMAMMALEITIGDEVLVPAYTWITSANCIEYVGAKAVLVDVKDDFNLDPGKMEAAITENTKAVVVVHEFGRAAAMNEIMAIAKKNHLKVIEDCACAIGTKYKGKPVGTIGDIGVFSFHPRKVITTGEGGMCITSNEKLAKKLDSLRNHGLSVDTSDDNYGKPFYMGEYKILGYNLRLSDIQAAVGVAQMDKLDRLLIERKKCAENYFEMLKDCDMIKLPQNETDYGSTFQSFVILLKPGMEKTRNRVMIELQRQGIQTKQGTHAVHRLGYYREKYGIKPEDYPVASYCEDCSITLPIFPGMTKEDQKSIIERLLEALKL
ncbi:MAG: DegT/DnrJ/EryC1/StrS family aminotransferase [Lachnospiraceae bacterium]|nr:DegT/DnrJ/EryC1/StrS family aminotransferase [Lachnospiraceae bacterium]